MEEPKIPLENEPAESASGTAFKEAPPSRASFKRRHWGKLLLLTLIALPIVVFTVWVSTALNWTYSSAQRAGFVQKISRKGWLCKTWEGTLYTGIAQGFRADSFQFSVRSDSIAHQLEALSGKKVTVHYEQHKGVPTSCFGETEYFVSRVQEIQP